MSWLLLVLSLPTENAKARMRAWRSLRQIGAAALRDGAYLLPAAPERRDALAAVAREVDSAGGQAYLLDLPTTEYPLADLFDRSADYAQLANDIAACEARIGSSAIGELGRQARRLRRSLATLTAIDFFPSNAARNTEILLSRLEARLQAAACPDEPSPSPGGVSRRDAAAFRGRLWATRRRPWVDRLASAWLIRRHIDPDARFVWLATPAERPAEAVGFDYDGAEFTHVGERVTFETLLAAFGLDRDTALSHLGRIVHCLDVGGLPTAEAPGIERLLGGMKSRLADDDALLNAASQLFDDLILAIQEELQTP